jgi:hypothetical protein
MSVTGPKDDIPQVLLEVGNAAEPDVPIFLGHIVYLLFAAK